MAEPLGALFLRAAQAPFGHAGTCILGRRIVAGLGELAPERLRGALRRAVDAVAREAGVSAREVERRLPVAELGELLHQLGEEQQVALQAWQRHAGHVGGLLEGVTDLTQDGRPPDVSLCLERLSQKVRADRAWSQPLRALSRTTFRYSELLLHCRAELDAEGALATARQRRRWSRAGLLGAALGAIVTAGAVSSWLLLTVQEARQRVAAVLDDTEVCAAERVAPGDLERASAAQQAAVAARRAQCLAERERTRRQQAEARRQAEEAARRARQAEEREARCRRLAAALARGTLATADVAAAGDASAQLLERVAARRLEPADLEPSAPERPCAETRSGRDIEAAFARAVVASPSAWLTAEDVSDSVRLILTERKDDLSPRARLLFGLHAETKAERALVSGEPRAVARALRLCGLKRSFEVARGSYCDALARSQQPGG